MLLCQLKCNVITDQIDIYIYIYNSESLGAEVATTSVKATSQGTWRHYAGALPGPSGPPASGSPQTTLGCQTSSIVQTELSHREGRQHRDLHPRGPDTALRFTDSSSAPNVHFPSLLVSSSLIPFVSASSSVAILWVSAQRSYTRQRFSEEIKAKAFSHMTTWHCHGHSFSFLNCGRETKVVPKNSQTGHTSINNFFLSLWLHI